MPLRALALFMLALHLVGCGDDEDPAAGTNVLLISIDTTRADYIGCYGGPDGVSPNIDALARRGVRFERALSPVPLTLPSHASMLTGLLPTTHSIRNNGLYRLDDEIPTLAEILDDHGYDTSAFVASFVLDGQFGLSAGFDVYGDDVNKNEKTTDAYVEERNAESVTDEFLSWFEEREDDSPFFSFVHYYDPHFPYKAPAYWQSRFADNPNKIEGAYSAEIAYCDHQIGRILKALEEKGVKDETLIIITSDHGESFREHGDDSHGYFLYQTTQRIPLIFSHPGVPQNAAEHDVANLIDVPPTVLGFLNLAPPQDMDGSDLLAIARGEEQRDSLKAGYMESELPRLAYGFRPLAALTDGRYKLIDASNPELYDLDQDPDEKANLASSQGERVENLRKAIATLRSVAPRTTEIELSPEARAKIEALGYVAGQRDAKVTKEVWANRDLLEVISLRNDGKSLMAAGEFGKSAAVLRRLVDRVPNSPTAHELLGAALAASNRFDEAIEILERAIELDWNLPDAHFNLALCSFRMKNVAKAKEHLEATVTLKPGHLQARFQLADLHLQQGNKKEAETLLESLIHDGQQGIWVERAKGRLKSLRN